MSTRSRGKPATRVPRTLDIGFVACVIVGAGLRLSNLGYLGTLFPDEAFSATVASRPLGDIWGYVRDTDPHPPLFYLLLKPVVAVTTDETMIRLPSAVFSVLALGVFALWQRRRAVEGLIATAFLAVLPFQLLFGREARMYGLMQLTGVVGAWAASRWLETAGRRWIAVAAGAGLVAAYAHAMGPLLLLGLFAVPLARRDRSAMTWRLGVGSAGLVYAIGWGPAALRWRSTSLYAPIDVGGLTMTLNELIAPVPEDRIIMLPLLCLGAWLLLRRRDDTARLWGCLFLFPVVVAAVAALKVAMFIPKTFVVISWGVPVALAAVVMAAHTLRPVAGVLTGAALALVILPSVPAAQHGRDHSDEIMAALRANVRDGDVVAVHPPENLIPWYYEWSADSSPAPDLGLPRTYARKVGQASFTGRLWLVEISIGEPRLSLAWPRCAPPQDVTSYWHLQCFDVPAPASPPM